MSEKKQEIFDDHAYVSLIEEARKKHLLDGVDCPFIPGRFEDGTPAVYDMAKEGGMAILKSGTTDLYGVPSEVHICLPTGPEALMFPGTDLESIPMEDRPNINYYLPSEVNFPEDLDREAF